MPGTGGVAMSKATPFPPAAPIDPTGPTIAPVASASPTDAELALIASAWPTLPPAIRAGIVAMVRVGIDGGV